MVRKLKNLIHLFVALCAGLAYGFPGRKLTVISVTGTSGKTTVVHLVYEILKEAGIRVSMVSTVRAIINGKEHDTGFHVTTPSPWALQKFISDALRGGSRYIVLEATSHALDQYRMFGTFTDIAVVTNITHEHLDYHGTYENYFRAKSRLFEKAGISVFNRDDKSFQMLKKTAKGAVLSYSLDNEADTDRDDLITARNLPGKYNAYNILAAISVAKKCRVDHAVISRAIKNFRTIPGRMEEIETDNSFRIFIDFAHKPDALQAVLQTLERMEKEKIIAVFGCAGERDRMKRPMMGQIAAEHADFIVLTAEDPRSEDVRNINREIVRGLEKGGSTEGKKNGDIKKFRQSGKKIHFLIPDRQEAINFAIRKLARKGDIVVMLGKGHEKSMCYGRKEYPWDERKAVRKALYGNVKTV